MSSEFKKIVADGYDRIAHTYLEDRRRDSENIHFLDELLQRLPPGARVLDLGCGAGEPITHRLAEKFQVTGVDISPVQIELARSLVPEATFVCADMTRLDLPAGSFEGICSYYAIIHVPREEHTALIADIHRWLVPGGLALLCLGATHLVDDQEDFMGANMYWSHYDSATYIQMLESSPFKILAQRLIEDDTSPGSHHFFVLAQKGTA